MKRLTAFALAAFAVVPAPARATGRVADAYGSPTDVRSYCRVVARAVADFEPKRSHTVRHLAIAGDFAVATVRIGFDSFNVMSRRTSSGWSEPYAVGPLYPRIETLTERGIPRSGAIELFSQLQRLDSIEPARRSPPCP